MVFLRTPVPNLMQSKLVKPLKIYRYKLADLRLFVPFITFLFLSSLACVVYLIAHIKNAQVFYMLDISWTVFLGVAFARYCLSRKPICVSEEGIGVATPARSPEFARWADVKRIERARFLSDDPKRQYDVVRVFFTKENRERFIMFEDRIGGYFGLIEILNDKITLLRIPAYDIRAPNKSSAVAVDRFDRFAA